MTENLGHLVFRHLRQDGEECHNREDKPGDPVDEGLRPDEHQGCRGDQTDYREPQHPKCLGKIQVVVKPLVNPEIRPANR